jgi:hypothetical protein
MPITVVEGFGTKFGYATTLGGTYTYLGEVLDLTPPALVTQDIKTTHMLTANKVHTYRPGLVEPGECKVTIHFDHTENASLYALRNQNYFWQVLFSDGSKLSCAGYLKEIGQKTPMDGLVNTELTIKASGDFTFVAGT